MNANTATLSGLSLALTAAALFAVAPIARADTTGSSAMGHCMGANACKGQGACKTASNACKGQNACKGKGFTVTTAAQCKAAGARFEVPKPASNAARNAQHG